MAGRPSARGGWEERTGGRDTPIATCEPTLDLIEDLGAIDATPFRGRGLTEQTRAWVGSLVERHLAWARAAGHFDEGAGAAARRILAPFVDGIDTGAVRLGNGDFQLRNFVERPDGRIALIDWDAARLSTFEAEHCVAYQWLLMWNNPAWQRAYLDGARRRLGLRAERFRAVLLIDVLKQAFFWRERDGLARMPLQYVAPLLSDDAFDARIWRGAAQPPSAQPRRRLW